MSTAKDKNKIHADGGEEGQWRPHQSWGGLIVEVAAKISAVGYRALKEAGLSHLSYGRIGVLSLLLISPSTQVQLCRKLGQKSPSMGEMLGRLKKDGLVTGVPNREDRRKNFWYLTPLGRKDILKVKSVFKKTGTLIDEALSKNSVAEKELERFKEILILFNAELSQRAV